MTSIRFTPAARRDTALVLSSYVITGDTARAQRIEQQLERALEVLGRHPTAFAVRPEWCFQHVQLRGINAGDHVIVFRVDGDVVTIVAVLHARQDIPGLLQRIDARE